MRNKLENADWIYSAAVVSQRCVRVCRRILERPVDAEEKQRMFTRLHEVVKSYC
jgi:hypothetical protein